MRYLKLYEEFTPNNPELKIEPPEVIPHDAEVAQQQHDQKKEEEKEEDGRRKQQEIADKQLPRLR